MSNDQKLFGISAVHGRWVFVLLGFVINLCLGSVYAYSVFKGPVEGLFKVKGLQGNLPFMIFLAFFAILMFFGGKLMEKFGPRNVSIVGGIIVGLGWILSYFSTSIWFLTVTYGVIAGAGVGLVYGCPIATAARWFPDKKGLAVGLTVAGFGGSPFVTSYVAKALIDSYGALTTFLFMGIPFLVITVILAIPLKFPVAGWKPEGWAPSATAAAAAVDLDAGQMVKTGTFWGILGCFTIGSLAGLMAIGISKTVDDELIITGMNLVGIFAIFNGLGRPIFGMLTDKVTPKWAAVLNLLIITVVSFGMLTARLGSVEVSKDKTVVKDGTVQIKDAELIQKAEKRELKKGVFVLKEGNADLKDRDVILKKDSLVEKDGAMRLKSPTMVTIIEKDKTVDLKQGAVVLKEGTVAVKKGSVGLYIACFIGFWICLGGWLAIAPTATATYFGLKNYARNYGVVFFAYGIGAVIGGIISGLAKDVFGSYVNAFFPTAALGALGVFLALIFIKPLKKEV